MGYWALPPVPGLIEPIAAPEFWIDGCGAIEIVGETATVYYFVRRACVEAPEDEMKMTVLKVRRPLSSISEGILQAARCVGIEREPIGPSPPLVPGPWTPRLVK